MVFFDSTGGLEEYNLLFFLMVTHSPVGALPLANIVTSDETTNTLIQALEMLKYTLPSSAFYGNLQRGPTIFMKDNCSELREALHFVWPHSSLLLCIFYLLQQIWRWLFEKKHNIAMEDRRGTMLYKKQFLNLPYLD